MATPERHLAIDLTGALMGEYVMRWFRPPLVRSKCEICDQRFGSEPAVEHDGRIVHATCVNTE